MNTVKTSVRYISTYRNRFFFQDYTHYYIFLSAKVGHTCIKSLKGVVLKVKLVMKVLIHMRIRKKKTANKVIFRNFDDLMTGGHGKYISWEL